MAGEEESDGVELALQPLRGKPGLCCGKRNLLARHAAAEQLALAHLGVVLPALRSREDRVDARMHARAVALQRIERTGGRKTLQHAFIDRARVHPACKVGDVAERS